MFYLLSTLQTAGAEATTVATCIRLRQRGRAATLITMRDDRDGAPARTAEAAGVPRLHLHAPRIASPGGLFRLIRILRAEPARVLHAQDRDGAILGAMAVRFTGNPFVISRHVLDEPPVDGRARAKRRLLSHALRRADRVVAVSDAVRTRLIADDGVAPGSISVIRNGVDPVDFTDHTARSARAALGWPDTPTVAMVAAMRPGKGHAAAIAVARRVRAMRPGTRFLFIGDGELRRALEADAGNDVEFLGTRDDIADVMAAADVIVLPSEGEALPTVLIEAALAGRPVVATAVGGVPEVVVDGETGVLIAPGADPEAFRTAFADAVIGLLADPTRSAALGASARLRARTLFDPDRQLDLLERVYADNADNADNADIADDSGTPRPLRVLYSNSHPSDLLAGERAGHLVRARALLAGLAGQGLNVTISEAAAGAGSQAAAGVYHGPLQKLPPRVALAIRDAGRIAQSAVHGLRLAQRARREHCDVIVETHNGMAIAGALASLLSGRPLVLDDITPADEENSYYKLGLPVLGRAVRRFTLGRARALVTVSESIRVALVAEGVPEARVHLVPNGALAPAAPEQGAAWRRAHAIDPGTPLIAYVGSFQSFHAVDLLIEALGSDVLRGPDGDPETAPAWTAVLAGDGDLRAATEDRARQRNIADRCLFVGRVPHDEVPTILAAADVAVLPGTAPYMNPMKLYDYLAAGLPIAAPDLATVREITRTAPDHPIALFEPGNAGALAQAIVSLLTTASGVRVSPAGVGTSWADRAGELATVLAVAARHTRRSRSRIRVPVPARRSVVSGRWVGRTPLPGRPLSP